MLKNELFGLCRFLSLFCPWNEQWKSTKSSWLTFSVASIRTIQNWHEQGMPVLRGGGKGNEVLYDSAPS